MEVGFWMACRILDANSKTTIRIGDKTMEQSRRDI